MVNDLPVSGIIRARLKDGSNIEGLIRGFSSGNNGPSFDKFFGGVILQSIDGKTTEIDVLDIENFMDVWNERHADFERKGLIKLIDWPTE
jgi:hypothetical protein